MGRVISSRRCLGLALALAACARAWAMGSPPLITDDPGTEGNGHWEINIGASTERRAGETVSELPVLDFNYGIGDRMEITYEVPYLVRRLDGEATASGFGKSGLSVKWRFLDGGEHGLSMSVYPKIEFLNPGSSAVDRGLEEPGSTFVLPFQLEKDLGPVTLNLEVGRAFRNAGEYWLYGAAVTRQVTDKVAIAVELAGRAAVSLDRSVLTLNFGFVVDMNERSSFLLSVGREMHNHDESRATLVGYVGLQFRL